MEAEEEVLWIDLGRRVTCPWQGLWVRWLDPGDGVCLVTARPCAHEPARVRLLSTLQHVSDCGRGVEERWLLPEQRICQGDIWVEELERLLKRGSRD